MSLSLFTEKIIPRRFFRQIVDLSTYINMKCLTINGNPKIFFTGIMSRIV